jgi:photosystem II stability/assembly factor-like uncharacterized protein
MAFKGQYAPELYDERKRYYLLQAQEFANLTDAELRDLHQISNTITRRIIQNEVGDSAIDDGFKIEEHPSDPINNFQIKGGNGTLDDPGVMFLKGYRLSLRDDIGYKDQTSSGSITDDAYTTTVLPALTTPSGSSHDFYGVSNNSNTVIVVGSESIALRSSNLGVGFSDNSCGTGILYGTTFSNASTVYAIGYDGIQSIIGKSTNSGVTWTNLISFSAFNPAVPTNPFYGVSFLSVNRGYIVGGLGKIYYTTDGGSNWNGQNSGVAYTLRSIDYYDSSSVWVVGDYHTILYSNDGVTWSLQVSSDNTHLTGVSVVDSSTVVVCGTGGTIERTINNGLVWLPVSSGTTSDLSSVFFVNTTGWAVGNNGTVLQSVNGGATWNSVSIDSTQDLKSVYFRDTTTGFIVGNSGTLFRTLDGTTWDAYRTDYAYVDFHLAEVSGNISSGSDYVDSTLVDPLIGLPSANRLRAVQDIKVSEGWPTPSDYTTVGVDGTVTQHYTYTLAKIHRFFGSSVIQNSDITDARTVVKTIAELDDALKNGGVDSSSIAAGSITPEKMDSGADFTVGSLQVLRDATIQGDLRIEGILHVEDYRPSTVTDSLIVHGSASIGDATTTDSSVAIFGVVIQEHDASRVGYNLHSCYSTSTAPVVNILQDGSGSILVINQATKTSFPLVDVTSSTLNYDLSIRHKGKTGGILKSSDDSTKISFLINKDATGSYAPVVDITTNAYGPAVNIHNIALCNTASINIDQSSGSAMTVMASGDASGIVINSSSSGTDVRIKHAGTVGYVMDATSSGSGTFNVLNTKGVLGSFRQQANSNLFSLEKDSSGPGRVIEINHSGLDPAVQINNDGRGIGLHISHVGDSTVPAIDVYVAGNEYGPAVRIRKANNDSTDDVGIALQVINQGYSSTVELRQDNTDSTSTLLVLQNLGTGYDASSLNWRIDRSGTIVTQGDASTRKIAFDSTHYLTKTSFYLDSGFDSSNPAISGKVFHEGGFLRISDGTNILPLIGGTTGLQGPTGLFGATGLEGIGSTGIQGPTGIIGPQGITGLMGFTGLALGSTGVEGATGFQGPTGVLGPQGTTGLQGNLGITGPTGIQGDIGPQGTTGLQGIGFTGLFGPVGPTGIQGIGLQGVTGLVGSTGVQGIGNTGLQGVTGAQGPTGIQGIYTVVDQTSSYVLLDSDHGKVYVNTNATAQIVFTLPSNLPGVSFSFIVNDSSGIEVDAAGGNYIRAGFYSSSSGGSIDSTSLWSSLQLVCIDATNWISQNMTGTWTLS